MKTIKLLLPILFALGCAGVDDTMLETEAASDAPTAADELYLPGEDREALDAEVRAMAAGLPMPAPFRIDDFPDPPGDEVEKGGLSMLTGWAVNGNLAYQDGVPGLYGQDHCSYFGTNCDYEWHLQANSVYHSTRQDFINEFRGACGAYNSYNDWQPCILPNLTPLLGGRHMKWTILNVDCPSNVLGHLNVGAQSAFDYLASASNPSLNLTFEKVAPTSNWNVLLICDMGTNQSGTYQATWRPRGNLTLRYGLATSGQPLNWNEECTTPGVHAPIGFNVWQSMDFAYSYNQGEILFDMGTLLDNQLPCSGNAATLRRGIRNVVIHEFGHHLGMHHKDYWGPSDGVMHSGAQTCQQMVSTANGYHEFERWAVADLDMTTFNPLQVVDNDLSCLIPFGY